VCNGTLREPVLSTRWPRVAAKQWSSRASESGTVCADKYHTRDNAPTLIDFGSVQGPRFGTTRLERPPEFAAGIDAPCPAYPLPSNFTTEPTVRPSTSIAGHYPVFIGSICFTCERRRLRPVHRAITNEAASSS